MLKNSCVCVAALAAVSGLVASLAPASVIVYGGPTYDTTTGTGYPNPALPSTPGSTAGNGMAVVYATKYLGGADFGTRALRWDASGTEATELGNLGTDSIGYTQSQAVAINTAGTAVGNADKYTGGTYLGSRAVRWDASGTAATELDNLGTNSGGTTYSYAYAINTEGTAVGNASKYSGDTSLGSRAVRWDALGTAATELGEISGGRGHFPRAINAAGTAVGSALKAGVGNTNLGRRAVRWDASGTAATELGHLGTFGSGYTISEALAVNTAGTAVGYANRYVGTGGYAHAVRWDASGIAATELGGLGTDSTYVSVAFAINDAGTAVGYAYKSSGLGKRAVRWDISGTAAAELGNLGTNSSGYANSEAYAINAAGTAVGFSQMYSGGTFVGQRAVAWGLDGVAIDLNTLLSPADAAIWTLTEAHGISDTNWVTGIGTFDPDGAGPLAEYNRAFLLQLPTSDCPSCAADYDANGAVDGNDLGTFIVDFETGGTCADVDANGGVDAGDLAYFFSIFEAGGCN